MRQSTFQYANAPPSQSNWSAKASSIWLLLSPISLFPSPFSSFIQWYLNVWVMQYQLSQLHCRISMRGRAIQWSIKRWALIFYNIICVLTFRLRESLLQIPSASCSVLQLSGMIVCGGRSTSALKMQLKMHIYVQPNKYPNQPLSPWSH